jgi:hypothetical protein
MAEEKLARKNIESFEELAEQTDRVIAEKIAEALRFCFGRNGRQTINELSDFFAPMVRLGLVCPHPPAERDLALGNRYALTSEARRLYDQFIESGVYSRSDLVGFV